MFKVLVPVDGSANSRHAVRHVINHYLKDGTIEVHLLNVQPPFSAHIARFVSKEDLAAFHRDEANKALQTVKNLLIQHGVPFFAHVEFGDQAIVITKVAHCLCCDQIVMATARKNSLTRMVEDSVTNKVLELTTVPVEVIAGDAVSKLERYGIPAAIGTALALLYAAAE